MSTIYEFLQQHQISYERFDHVAVFTCEEAESVTGEIPGAGTKNLFLRDKKGKNYFLLSVTKEKQVDLKALSKILNSGGLSFGSPEKLKQYLGVEPGSVTLLGLIHDLNRELKVFIDEDLWKEERLQCHPLVNTGTLVIAKTDLEKFFKLTGHVVTSLKVPVKSLSEQAS